MVSRTQQGVHSPQAEVYADDNGYAFCARKATRQLAEENDQLHSSEEGARRSVGRGMLAT